MYVVQSYISGQYLLIVGKLPGNL